MKKKMKKIFSKITVLILLVATLVPYVNIPTAEAATEKECNGEWEYHTNYYFFLQAEHPHTWVNYLATDYDGNGTADGKVTTRYFTSFLYNFPVDGSKIVFEDSGFVKIEDDEDYEQDFDAGAETNRKKWNAGQFYYEWENMDNKMTSHFSGNLSSYAYTSGEGSSDSRIVTYLFHGDWAYIGANSNNDKIVWDLNDIDVSDDSVEFDDIEEQVDASILINKSDASITQAKIGAGVLDQSLEFDMDVVKESIETYNNGYRNSAIISNGKVKDHNNKEYDIGQPVIKMIIERNYDIKDVFTKNNEPSALRIGENGTHYATYSGKEYLLNTTGDNKIQIGETLNYINVDNNNEKVAVSDIKTIEGDDDGVWIVAPTLYQLSYKVCKDAKTPVVEGDGKKEEVTLSYNDNKPSDATGNVTGMPENQKQEKGTEFTISDKKPELEGYKFKSWNISPKCDGQSYEPSYKLGKLENNTPLYACWGSTDTAEPGKTGVLTYTGLFAGIIALAGGSYYLIKKKNLFKKI